MPTLARHWIEPLSPHLLDRGAPPAAAPASAGGLFANSWSWLWSWPRPMRLSVPRRPSAAQPEAVARLTAEESASERLPEGREVAGAHGAPATTPEEDLRVGHIMATDLVTVTPDTPVHRIADLFVRHGIGSAPVINQRGRLAGIVSEGDLLRRAEIGTERRRPWWRALLTDARTAAYEYVRSHGRTAADVMTLAPVTTTESAPLHEAADLMARYRLRQVPVMRGRRLVGMVGRTDLIRQLAGQSAAEPGCEPVDDETLRERVMNRLSSVPWSMRLKLVHATVQGGIATLYGWVASDIERRALQVVAENTPGVRAVEDRIYSVPPSV